VEEAYRYGEVIEITSVKITSPVSQGQKMLYSRPNMNLLKHPRKDLSLRLSELHVASKQFG
jgi:hypothetical protein